MPSSAAREPAPASVTLFQEPWWLDAVAPGSWVEAVVRRGDDLAARWPLRRRRRWGLTILDAPPLTPFLGPWVRCGSGKTATRVSDRYELLSALIAGLPSHHHLISGLQPGDDLLLPLAWQGFTLIPRWTSRITDLSDPERVWNGFSEERRRNIRRAERELTVRDDLAIGALLTSCRARFGRQRMTFPYGEELLARVDAACNARSARLLLTAHDATDRLHAAAYIVYDGRCAFYLLGGLAIAESPGAPALLLWEGLRRLAGRTAMFDFEGSMVPAIERFVRGFGGIPTVCFRASRSRWPLDWLRRVSGR